jgi:Flp pilus assembly protein TadB
MKGIITAILDHFTEFTWKRFRSFLIVILVILLAFVAFDSYTSFFSMSRLSREADLISKMQGIESSNYTRSPELESAYISLRRQVSDQVSIRPWMVRISAPNINISYSILWKFFAGLAPWALLSLILIPDIFRRKQGSASSFLGFYVIGIGFGLVSMIFPTYRWPWFNLLCVPFILLMFLFGLVVYVGIKTSKKQRAQNAVEE